MQPGQPTKPSRIVLGIAGFSIAALEVAGCGGRELPAAWPEKSAASPAAESAPPASVTQALSGPPPLPGEASSWVGLSSPPDAAAHDHGAHAPTPSPRAGHGEAAREEEGSDGAVRYVCPMHPDVVADQPGTCPRCGMALVKRDGSK